MVAPLSTAGVSDEFARELQLPLLPQMLEDVEEPMLARPATLRDPGIPDQTVREQHSLTHFPSQLCQGSPSRCSGSFLFSNSCLCLQLCDMQSAECGPVDAFQIASFLTYDHFFDFVLFDVGHFNVNLTPLTCLAGRL